MSKMTVAFHYMEDGVKATLYYDGSLALISRGHASQEEAFVALAHENMAILASAETPTDPDLGALN